jgi:hypothetical protein
MRLASGDIPSGVGQSRTKPDAAIPRLSPSVFRRFDGAALKEGAARLSAISQKPMGSPAFRPIRFGARPELVLGERGSEEHALTHAGVLHL